MITFIEAFTKELEQEAVQTRRMLEIVPTEKMDWQPHPKSMTIKALSQHIAEIPLMNVMALKYDKWDFSASPYQPKDVINTQELVARFEECLNEAREALSTSSDFIIQDKWQMVSGDQVWLEMEKWEAVRHAFGQNAHHRAQLQVCLRLLDIPVPGPYGPSADEM